MSRPQKITTVSDIRNLEQGGRAVCLHACIHEILLRSDIVTSPTICDGGCANRPNTGGNILYSVPVSLPAPGEEIWLFPYGPPSSFYWPRLRSAVSAHAQCELAKRLFTFAFHRQMERPRSQVCGCGGRGEGKAGTHFMQMNSRPINILFQLCSMFPLSYLSECGRK